MLKALFDQYEKRRCSDEVGAVIDGNTQTYIIQRFADDIREFISLNGLVNHEAHSISELGRPLGSIDDFYHGAALIRATRPHIPSPYPLQHTLMLTNVPWRPWLDAD